MSQGHKSLLALLRGSRGRQPTRGGLSENQSGPRAISRRHLALDTKHSVTRVAVNAAVLRPYRERVLAFTGIICVGPNIGEEMGKWLTAEQKQGCKVACTATKHQLSPLRSRGSAALSCLPRDWPKSSAFMDSDVVGFITLDHVLRFVS